jgi:DNA mismatch endonuclease, patch repair protein
VKAGSQSHLREARIERTRRSKSSGKTRPFFGSQNVLESGGTFAYQCMDRVAKKVRSAIMSAVPQKNTAPEKLVRSALYRKGFRYRLHVRSLPGTPDIVLTRHRTVVLVHGCFWHGHDCRLGRRPTSNTRFWNAKLSRNAKRDADNVEALNRAGWRVFIIWTCSIKSGLNRLMVGLGRIRRPRATNSRRNRRRFAK